MDKKEMYGQSEVPVWPATLKKFPWKGNTA